MRAQWIKFFIFRNSRLCSLWLKRNFLLLRRPFFLLLIFQNKKSWWVLKSTWKNLQNERNPTSVAQTVWFWDQKMWKGSDFLVSARKWLACDSAHALEMIDDALELTRAWNGMFVCFVRGYNVGPMNLNWAFVLEIESNPDFFAILNWQIWLTQVTCGKLGQGEKISI